MGLVHESVQQMGDNPQNRRLAEILVDGQLSGAMESTPRYVSTREDVTIASVYVGHALAALGVDADDDAEPVAEAIAEPVAEPVAEAPAATT
jgi:hypothetical protein